MASATWRTSRTPFTSTAEAWTSHPNPPKSRKNHIWIGTRPAEEIASIILERIGNSDVCQTRVRTDPQTIAERAREAARRIEGLAREVVRSFVAPDARARVTAIRQSTIEIQYGMTSVVGWLERRRPPETAELIKRRLLHAVNEAVACAAYDTPEYAGGFVSESRGRPPSEGAQRTAVLVVTCNVFATALRDWAEEIEAEETQRRATIGTHMDTPASPQRGSKDETQSTSAVRMSEECEDGTNVPRGTDFCVHMSVTEDWYRPDQSRSTAGWRERWARLRIRFEQIVDECRPIACALIERRVPAYPKVVLTWDEVLRGHDLIQSGGGLKCDPAQLFTPDGLPLLGVFPIHDVNGTPMSNSAGEAFGFRYGVSRQYSVYSRQSDLHELRPLPGPRLFELARDGTTLLYQLPPDVAGSVWRNWRFGFSRKRHSDEYLWFDALFELSWQRKPGDVLNTKRHAWYGNVSIQLDGQGLFPRLPDLSSFGPSLSMASIPADNGYPVAWRSVLPDVARASIIAIDELLERANDSQGGISHDDVMEDALLRELKRLPAAQFEELVYRFDRGNAVPGRHAAQAERAVELLRLLQSQRDGIAQLQAAILRIREHGQ